MKKKYKKESFFSAQEKRVILLMKHEGLKPKGVAEIMEIDQKTVSSYIARIRQKLGLSAKANDYLLITTANKYL